MPLTVASCSQVRYAVLLDSNTGKGSSESLDRILLRLFVWAGAAAKGALCISICTAAVCAQMLI